MLPDEADLLLVQDNPLEVELTLRPLRDLDPASRVAVARDGEEALDYVLGRGAFRHRIGGSLPRLILLEFRMPRVDGVEVLRALRASPRASSVPVVMLLPASDAREVAQCYQVGANSCVLKPVEFPAFYQTIQAIGRYWLGINLPVAAASAGAAATVSGRGASGRGG
ncbi:MAG TPA: response regulator [Gemmatimonadales bacterium]|jgi:CheY-like chemotaxis protein